jgi:hypothetical protein
MPAFSNILRTLAFGVIGAAVIITFRNNANKWASALQQYFVNQPKTLFSRNDTWKRPLGLTISKTIIIFLGFMLIVGAYAFCFGVGY